MPARWVALFGAAWCLLIGGCATWQAPQDADYASLRARASTATTKEIHLRATALSSENSRQLFGADVNKTGVQPVWIEVENNTQQTLWLLRSGTDPDYFSPLEVAWSFHTPFGGKTNDQIDSYFGAMGFENPIAPGTTQAGIIFSNPHSKTMLLNVDLLGQGELFPFTLFPLVPDDEPGDRGYDVIVEYARRVDTDYQDAAAFRAALEEMPCCTTIQDKAEKGDPVNVVLIGEWADIAAAVVRRGFRRQQREIDQTQRLFDRPPDAVARKTGQGGVSANWMRFWLAPLTFKGHSVFLVQAGRPVGGRFAVSKGGDLTLHPNVDEVRNLLIQDLLYSGGLGKLAFARGGGESAAHYQTDGLRAVMFMVTRPLPLSGVEILNWEPYLPRRAAKQESATHDERQ